MESSSLCIQKDQAVSGSLAKLPSTSEETYAALASRSPFGRMPGRVLPIILTLAAYTNTQ